MLQEGHINFGIFYCHGSVVQETHIELADRTGKCIVQYRGEEGNRPTAVALPSPVAVKRKFYNKDKEDDLSKYFDLYRGAHRPKILPEIQGTNADVLANIEIFFSFSYFFRMYMLYQQSER